MANLATDDFTLILNQAAGGDGGATEALWERCYPELLAIARHIRPSVPAASTRAPTPTTIIHESFVKTFGPGRHGPDGAAPHWDSRAHFFGSVARAMGQFLIDWRRSNGRIKRGRGRHHESLDESRHERPSGGSRSGEALVADPDWLPMLIEALERLRRRAPQLADVVWMRCMAGLSLEDTAVVLGIRPRTVSKRWNLGRALLRREISSRLGDA